MKDELVKELKDVMYIGDGVYAGYDGYHIVLWLNEPGVYGPNAIGLEPEVLAMLDRYRERVKGK